MALDLPGPQAWEGPGQEVAVCGRVLSCPGASLRTCCASGALEEVEMQVFPDAEVDHRMADAAGDGQVRDCLWRAGLWGRSGLWGRAAHRLLVPQDGRRQQPQASAPPDGAPSLQNMGLLLDKLAKENQDVRLLQAQLQVGTGRKGWARPAPLLGPVSVLVSSPQ